MLLKDLLRWFQSKRNVGPIIFNEFDKEGIEIELTDEYIMVVNSEGKFETPDFNYIATVLAKKSGSIMPNDWIAGNVLICLSKW